ncbi:MAG: NADH-quinone oxidoreductase subunit NuoH [Pseudomonadota bacterium]|jgi:NADH-quinone oxidoreductase subunit H
MSQDVLNALLAVGTVFLIANTMYALLIWVERRGLALVQDRRGPNRVGPLGLGIVIVDTIKIFTKEDWTPPFADRSVFTLAPLLALGVPLMAVGLIPFSDVIHVWRTDVGLLMFLAFSAVGAYAVILAGWSSNNKYSLLGGLRATAQLISYEVFMGLSMLGPALLADSFDLAQIVQWQARHGWNVVWQAPSLVLFFIAALAETHRAPFDLPEAESEIVAGFHSEYSGIKFGMFFLAEYVGVFLMSCMMTTLWLGGSDGPWMPGVHWFMLKTFLFIGLFILIRAALPRPRHDQLLAWGWKYLFPAALLNLLAVGAVVIALSHGGAA